MVQNESGKCNCYQNLSPNFSFYFKRCVDVRCSRKNVFVKDSLSKRKIGSVLFISLP